MTYSLTRNYDTDRSRTNVRTALANAAKELADAKGIDVPTKTVFEEPDIVDEGQNRFEIAVRPTVTDAGIEPEDIIPSEVTVRGVYIKLLGMKARDGERDRATAHVIVMGAEDANTSSATEWDTYLSFWNDDD